jgi:hypothetical protein
MRSGLRMCNNFPSPSNALNKVADALSWKSTLLTTMKNEVIGFHLLKDSLSTNPLFGPIVGEVSLGV